MQPVDPARRWGTLPTRVAVGALGGLGLLLLFIGRSDASHVIDLAGLGAFALAAYLARGGHPRRRGDAILFWLGVLLTLPLAALLALAFFVNVVMGGCVYGYYDQGQCGRPDPLPVAPQVVLTDRDNGSTIELGVDDRVDVRLDEYVPALWTMEGTVYPQLAETAAGHDERRVPDGYVGGASIRWWRFQAATPGSTTLHMTLRYPWESPTAPAMKTFQVTVRIAAH